MADGPLADVLLPLAIVLIMIAMGMTLTGADFVRLRSQSRAVVTGVVCQVLVLPALGFAAAWLFDLDTVFAVGMVLLASSPGGSTSNLIVHVTDLDRPLSLALTAISNVFVFVTMPVSLTLAQDAFGELDGDVAVPVGELIVQIAALTVVPIGIGMAVRAKAPEVAIRFEEPGKRLASTVFAVIVFALVVQNWDVIVDDAPDFAPAFIAMNLAALGLGWGIARGAGLSDRESATIALEVGVQNGTLAIAVALSVFDNDDLALVPGLYGLWMLITGFGFAFLARRSAREPALADG